MYAWLILQLAVPFAIVTILVIIAYRGAKKVRRDIFRLAGVEEEEDEKD